MKALLVVATMMIVSIGMAAEFDKGTSSGGCWLKLYTAKNFNGRVVQFNGPVQVATMRPEDVARGSIDHTHFGIGQPDSFITGPGTSVTFYSRRHFRGRNLNFGPDTFVDELEDYAVGRTIDSFVVRCH